MPTTAVLKLPAAAIGMPRESGPPGPAQESLLGSEEAAPELNAFEAFRAGRKLVMNPADHLRDYCEGPVAVRTPRTAPHRTRTAIYVISDFKGNLPE